MATTPDIDVEKHDAHAHVSVTSSSPSRLDSRASKEEEEAAGVQVTRFGSTGVLARLRGWEAVLDRRLGVESHGPDRILPEARESPRLWVIWAVGGFISPSSSLFFLFLAEDEGF